MHRESGRESGGRGRPRTLALLVDWLEDDYQNEVVSGVADAAKELGVNLICFAGGVLRSPHRFAAQRNAVYDLAGAENVDGLMLMSGTLGNHIGPEELSRYCQRWRPLPMCSIAVPLPGIPSVLVDNVTGMRALIVHLVEAHRCRRVAFIRGPEANDEAERRYRVYCDVLGEHGMIVDPDLVVVGDFERAAGAAAVSVLLDERRVEVDAIAAASDSMALGAIDALRSRGVRVPEDVAVVGFDDIEAARFATPPLTTVRQPLHEQGRRAVELLLAEIRGEPVPAQVTLHTELVKRHSCGCAFRFTRHDSPPAPPAAADSFAAAALAALVTAFDVASLARAAVVELPRLGIGGFYLSLYEPGEDPPSRSRLVIAHDAALAAPFQPADPIFPSRELMPRGALPDRRATFVLEPLFFKEQQLGFALFEMGPREGAIYESLREQISAALKGALLVQEVVDKDRVQARLLADLGRRARELEEANRALQENQEKLLISEKLASLGRLTASIVHEMNTPLAAVRAALVDLGKLVTEYQQSAADPAVTPADHLEIASEMRQAIGLSSSAAERAAIFVRGIKSQTRDLGPHERRPFDVTQCIREALLFLGYALRRGSCRVVFDPPADPIELVGSPVRLSQVVTNLVENAIDASAPRGGAITLTLAEGPEALVLEVRDEGSGIAPEVLPRIFEPMFTTKPFGQGTGLGLSIVRDIVTGDFGGTIRVTSEVGLGATFTVSFPHATER